MRKRKRKLFVFDILGRNKSGIILILVLWILVILTTLALSLGRRTVVDTSLTSNLKRRLKAKYSAWAGLNYAKKLIAQDSSDSESKKVDTLYYCGIRPLKEDSLEAIFKSVDLGQGVFTIQHERLLESDESESMEGLSDDQMRWGFVDEERFLNINAVNVNNIKIFIYLINSFIEDEEVSKTIAYSTLDWKDKDKTRSHDSFGAENDEYEELESPYLCKNAPFDSKEEWMMVRGVTPEIYHNLKDYITIYPRKGNLKVNFNTASSVVLKSLGAVFADDEQEKSHIDSLIQKMIHYRQGEDGQAFTSDDREVKYQELPLTSEEKNLFLRLNQYRISRSSYFRVKILGRDVQQKSASSLEAVIQRKDLSIVYWKR